MERIGLSLSLTLIYNLITDVEADLLFYPDYSFPIHPKRIWPKQNIFRFLKNDIDYIEDSRLINPPLYCYKCSKVWKNCECYTLPAEKAIQKANRKRKHYEKQKKDV